MKMHHATDHKADRPGAGAEVGGDLMNNNLEMKSQKNLKGI